MLFRERVLQGNAGTLDAANRALLFKRHLQMPDFPHQRLGPKPWPDRPAPWEDDNDGNDNGVYDTDPGEQRDTPPSDDDPTEGLNLRATLAAAATRATDDPDAFRALLAIESRLAEISLYLKDAQRGLQGEALTKLLVLARIL
jgi:hypothetical protein